MLVPLHAGCYSRYAAAQPWYRRPGWPVNRWSSLLWFNLLLLGLVLPLHWFVAPIAPGRLAGFAVLLAFIVGWQLLARLVSYVSLERHLPAQAPAGPERLDDPANRT